jgi:sugar O-acyltransferase (sialic acid O-acetyltransferase NeuD family)
MMKEKVVLIGSGGHAKVVADILREMGTYEIIGVTVKDTGSHDTFCGYPILGGDEVLPKLINDGVRSVAIGIGGFTDNNLRKRVYTKVKALGFRVVSAIHPRTAISGSASLGEGVVIFPGVIINTEVRVGNNVVIATGSTVDHETTVEDHVLISAGVTIGAYASIREGALIALGAKIVSGIQVGKNALVAAGGVVIENVGENARVFGVPARPRQGA